MAHLTEHGGKRAQILIVSAFALGVLFVALALILNSAIFTENLASRGETTGGEQVIKYQDTLDRGVGKIVTAENENVTDGSTSYGTLNDRIRRGATNLSAFLTRQNIRTGATSDISLDARTDGTLIRQQDSSRQFTNESGSVANWTVAGNINRTRAFALNITKSELSAGCIRFVDCFTLNVTNGTDNWRVSINDTSGVTVEVENPSGATETCGPEPGDHVVVDITGGVVNGTACPALNFTETPDTPYDIEYRNGNETGGTYSLVVDNTTLSSTAVHLSSSTGSNPSATPALYDVTLEYDYQTAQLNYSSAVRVAPGEPDE